MSVIKTQGTELFAINDSTVLDVGCVTGIDGISAPSDQIETTCLNASSRTYVQGLRTPGTATFTVYLDTSNTTHIDLHEAYKNGTIFTWGIGFSDRDTTPTDNTLTPDRSWVSFDGYISDFPFSFEQNSVVEVEISVQIAGEISLQPKSS